METKLIEVRDRNTFVPAMAIRVASTGDAAADWLFRRAGYSLDARTIILMRLTDCEGQYDVYKWRDTRTMRAVHDWLERARPAPMASRPPENLTGIKRNGAGGSSSRTTAST